MNCRPERSEGSAFCGELRTIYGRCRSLHVGHLPIEKRHLQVLVYKNLFGAKIDDLVRRADHGSYLIGGLSFFNLLRLGRRRLLLRLSGTTTVVSYLGLVISIGIGIRIGIRITIVGAIDIAALSTPWSLGLSSMFRSSAIVSSTCDRLVVASAPLGN